VRGRKGSRVREKAELGREGGLRLREAAGEAKARLSEDDLPKPGGCSVRDGHEEKLIQ